MAILKATVLFALLSLSSASPRVYNRGYITRRDDQQCVAIGTQSHTGTVTLGPGGSSSSPKTSPTEGTPNPDVEGSSDNYLILQPVNANGESDHSIFDQNGVATVGSGTTMAAADTGLPYDAVWKPNYFLAWQGCSVDYNGKTYNNKDNGIDSSIFSSPFYNSDTGSCAVQFPCPAQIGYKAGRCGVHVTQYQKPDPSKDSYSYDVTMYDDSHAVIGQIKGQHIEAQQTYDMASQLPYTFEIKSGNVDDDPVSFAYAGYNFDSNSGCSVGAYDSGNRQMDCGFGC